jgi:hypothetical protein
MKSVAERVTARALGHQTKPGIVSATSGTLDVR